MLIPYTCCTIDRPNLILTKYNTLHFVHALSLSLSCTQDSNVPNGDDGSNVTTCNFTPVTVLSDTDTLPTIDAQKGVVSAQTIAGSVIGSCIVLMLLIVAFVLLVVCFKRRKKTKKSYGNDVDLSVNLINPVYVPRGELHSKKIIRSSLSHTHNAIH